MTVGDAMRMALQLSLQLVIFAAGLRAEPRHASYLFRHPGELGRTVLSMFVVMPVLAIAMVRAFDLNPAVKVTLVAFALSPVPPLMPVQATRVSHATDYTIGLLVAASLLSILIIPLAMELLNRAFGGTLAMSPAVVSKQMLLGVLVPLGVGMVVRRYSPLRADRLARWVSTSAFVVLVACLVVILIEARRALGALIGHGTLLAIAVFIAAGLAVGHLLGGSDPERRSVLAIATSMRHPGIAIAIAHTNFPAQKLADAAALLCLLVGFAVRTPYQRWMSPKRPSHTIRERHV